MTLADYNKEVTKVLLTGSEGFLGKKLNTKLRSLGFHVTTVDKVADTSGHTADHYKLNLTDPDFNQKLLGKSFDLVIHTAAQTSVPFSMSNILADASANIISTINLLEFAKICSCSHFIYSQSGGAIYSPESELPIREDSNTRPSSPYGLSKLVGEQYVSLICEMNGIEWSSLAFSNIYGNVFENPKGVIFEFWKKLSNGERPNIYGINSTRDFLYIDDAISSFVCAINNPLNARVNISSAKESPLGSIFEIVSSELGKGNIGANIYPARQGEIIRSALDNRKAKNLLNWEPLIDLDTGIRNSIGGN